MASVPLRDDSGFLSIPVRIAGQPARLMIDTGSDGGLVTPQAVASFHLAIDPGLHVLLQGTRSAPVARLRALTIGTLRLDDVAMPVGSLPGAPNLTPAVVGFLGGDVLSQFDLDIDVLDAPVSFYRVGLPSLACAEPPAWKGSFTSVPLVAHGARLSLSAILDGHPITALLDTGARSRILSQAAARRVGVSAETLAGDPGGIASGVDLSERVYHWHAFRSLAIGGETVRSPVLTVTPLSEPFDMLLGADWLRQHRTWVSYSTRQMFVRGGTKK